ncbi:MAG: NAD(P)-binding domain-containing protein [Cyanobacteria bacterium P01_A01_bin.123]
MKIGIINAGNIGRTLAKPWLKAGHQLKLGTHQFGGDYGRLAPTFLQARELAA